MKGYSDDIVAIRHEAISPEHSRNLVMSSINIGDWICVLCNKRFGDVESVREHLRQAHLILKITQGCFDGCALIKEPD